jgi:hypothetical protein
MSVSVAASPLTILRAFQILHSDEVCSKYTMYFLHKNNYVKSKKDIEDSMFPILLIWSVGHSLYR